MKEVRFDEIDRDIHARLGESGIPCPRYSQIEDDAHALIERVNSSGRYRVTSKRVVGESGQGETDWQCEVYSPDGLDNLATEFDATEPLAICRALAGADVSLV